jgi:hypothetical protein
MILAPPAPCSVLVGVLLVLFVRAMPGDLRTYSQGNDASSHSPFSRWARTRPAAWRSSAMRRASEQSSAPKEQATA